MHINLRLMQLYAANIRHVINVKGLFIVLDFIYMLNSVYCDFGQINFFLIIGAQCRMTSFL